MYCVCFVQKEKYSTMSSLAKKLSEHFCVFSADKESSFQKGLGEPLVLIDSRVTRELEAESCVIVFDEDASFVLPDITCENIAAVVGSSDKGLISSLSSFGIPMITCGVSQKDTFTYSSFTEERTIVSLQRSIASFSGKIIEPFELPVEIKVGDSAYCALAYAAVLTQLGAFDGGLIL